MADNSWNPLSGFLQPLLQPVFNACMLLMVAATALNVAILLLIHIWPWLLGALGIWGVVKYVRWRRYQW